jgi:carbon-monoxide dehydrogenase medium subunit
VCRKARVALGSVSPKPIRAYLVEKELENREITDEVLERCVVTVNQEISPISDIRGSAEYRRQVAAVLLKRAIRQAHMGRK